MTAELVQVGQAVGMGSSQGEWNCPSACILKVGMAARNVRWESSLLRAPGSWMKSPELCSGSPEMQVDSRQLTWALGRGEGLSEWQSIAS